jgi:F0F1-type ATP synthase assembly protein I
MSIQFPFYWNTVERMPLVNNALRNLREDAGKTKHKTSKQKQNKTKQNKTKQNKTKQKNKKTTAEGLLLQVHFVSLIVWT